MIQLQVLIMLNAKEMHRCWNWPQEEKAKGAGEGRSPAWGTAEWLSRGGTHPRDKTLSRTPGKWKGITAQRDAELLVGYWEEDSFQWSKKQGEMEKFLSFFSMAKETG